MIFIVTPSAKRQAIMKAIMQGAGADTPANAYVFSMPISACAGFASPDEADPGNAD